MPDAPAPTPSIPHDQYEALAPLYDLLIPDPPGMNAFYLDAAARFGVRGPILEVGAGTGRLTVELAAAGHEVIAFDLSRPMLGVLDHKRGRMPAEQAARIHLVVGDQAELELPAPHARARFEMIASPGGTLQHVTSIDELDHILLTHARRLAPGGILVADLAGTPVLQREGRYQERYPDSSLAKLSARWTTVESWNESFFVQATGTTETTCYFHMRGPAGEPTDELAFPFRYTYVSPQDLRGSLERAGLEVLELHGDFRGAPPAERGGDLVTIARMPR